MPGNPQNYNLQPISAALGQSLSVVLLSKWASLLGHKCVPFLFFHRQQAKADLDVQGGWGTWNYPVWIWVRGGLKFHVFSVGLALGICPIEASLVGWTSVLWHYGTLWWKKCPPLVSQNGVGTDAEGEERERWVLVLSGGWVKTCDVEGRAQTDKGKGSDGFELLSLPKVSSGDWWSILSFYKINYWCKKILKSELRKTPALILEKESAWLGLLKLSWQWIRQVGFLVLKNKFSNFLHFFLFCSNIL